MATQDPLRQRALVVPDKAERVHAFHDHTLRALAELIAAAGLQHPEQIEARHVVRRISETEVRMFAAAALHGNAGRVARRAFAKQLLHAHLATGAGGELSARWLSRAQSCGIGSQPFAPRTCSGRKRRL